MSNTTTQLKQAKELLAKNQKELTRANQLIKDMKLATTVTTKQQNQGRSFIQVIETIKTMIPDNFTKKIHLFKNLNHLKSMKPFMAQEAFKPDWQRLKGELTNFLTDVRGEWVQEVDKYLRGPFYEKVESNI